MASGFTNSRKATDAESRVRRGDGGEDTPPPSGRSEARFRNLIDNFHDGIAIAQDGVLLYANDALVEMLGYRHTSEVLRLSPERLLRTHVDQDEVLSALAALDDVAQGRGQRREDERPLTTCGNRRLVAHFFHDAICFDSRPAVMTTVRDVTESREIRTHLERADRLASLGTMAAGVAHEINNPLAYVISNLSYCLELLERLPGGSTHASYKHLFGPEIEEIGCTLSTEDVNETIVPMRQALADARDGANRVARIVRDLKSMTRDDDELSGPVDLEAVLDCAVHMVENEIRYRATLRREYATVGCVRGNETRLVQVFVNLLLNASQAFDDEGSEHNVITVRSRSSDENWVIVEVEDTGRGIPREMLDRVFDPFFTTKPVGVGTGLGLSICHGLIYSMNGRISVTSEAGQGTCFRVELRSDEGEAPHSIAPARMHAPGARARLLVIDDEPLILRSLSRILSKHHDVDLVVSGSAGLAKLRSGEEYDLIICDLMMPDVTGMDFHATLTAEAPDLADRVVFLTGGAFTDHARSYLESVHNPTLEKPIQPDVLRAVLDRMLGTLEPGALRLA